MVVERRPGSAGQQASWQPSCLTSCLITDSAENLRVSGRIHALQRALLRSLELLKRIRHQKQRDEFSTGASDGLVLSSARAVDSHFEREERIFLSHPLRIGRRRSYNRMHRFSGQNIGVEMTLAAASNAVGVLVVDSNRMQAQLLANALRRRTEFTVAICPMEIDAILQSVESGLPRVALIALPPARIAATVAVLRNFHLAHPGIAKVLLVDSCDRDLVISIFRAGARGIFPFTDADVRQLCKCILRVAAGQIWTSTEQLNYIMEMISEVPSIRVLNTSGARLLTPREEQVVALVAEGLGNRPIARELKLSEHTIKKYLFRIFEKLGISSRVELVLYALNNGDPQHAERIAARPQPPPAA